MASYGTPPSFDRESVLGPVRAPAYAMMVMGVLGTLMYLALIAVYVLGAGAGLVSSHGRSEEMVGQLLGSGMGIVWAALGAAANIAIVLGGLSMSRGGNYVFAWIATILTFLPCWSPCCCAGVLIAVWSGFILSEDPVRQAFG